MNDSENIYKTSMAKCRFPDLTIEELLYLQLSGLSLRQLQDDTIDTKSYLKETIRNDVRKWDKARRILERQEKAGIVSIPYYADDYPCRLKVLNNDVPILVHVLGSKELLYHENSVAVIGARAADKKGLGIAYFSSQQLAKQGYPVISGLALGCDTAAHRGCLDAGGQTMAVVASGLDITHPKVNKTLQQDIVASGGTILSEYPFGVKANPTRLVTRCRIQAALSHVVIVAQCPIISGTMYAVRFAKMYGRNVYATRFDRQNELNTGNKFLLDYGIAQPISTEYPIWII